MQIQRKSVVSILFFIYFEYFQSIKDVGESDPVSGIALWPPILPHSQ